EYARQLADSWRKGLADWGQSPDRIKRLRESSEWRIYTPGSEAGLPLSILQTFAAPKGTVTREALNQKIDATTTALLGLTGITADPVQSREHILIAQLLLHAWGAGRDLDLQQLIEQIQAPPLGKIGAFDVDTFYPEKERLKLAVTLNNILAAPSFSTWITGETLDLSRMLYAGNKPRQLVFYIAHLEDAQRLFFLTLLLEEVLSWTRKQPGTTGLRAILYFDEVFGYLPPHPANPPTKTPLMTLLKQARAFGVGVLLATQNPVDLDYKALSNAGSWFVGKLQTERDKARLVEGLEGVAAERGTLSNRAYLETVISALGNRVFLLHDVHRNKPLIFQSRWALSFLRGPMTRDQVALLMDPVKKAATEAQAQAATAPETDQPGAPAAVPAAVRVCRRCRAELSAADADVCPHCGEHLPHFSPQAPEQGFKQALQRPPAAALAGPAGSAAPVLPAGLAQFYLPVTVPAPVGTTAVLVYQPRLLGFAEVAFADKHKGIEHRRPYRLLAQPPAAGQAVRWDTADAVGEGLAAGPEAEASWLDTPEPLNTAKKLKTLERDFADFLYAHARLALLANRELDLVSEPGEDVMAFQVRCRAAARRQADKAVAEARPKYSARFEALDAHLPGEAPRRGDGASQPGPAAASVLDLIFSWNPFRPSAPIGRPLPPPSAKEKARLAREEQARLKLQKEWQSKVAAIAEKWKRVGEQYTEMHLTPRKADVRVTHFGLAWAPFWRATDAAGSAATGPAYAPSTERP
ncbi:MAG TPA: hypothetical protein VG013_25840, partial [Gemmataceae bacterium]|nr:hypothetical protein [Gemmataceae bacterium]